MISRNSKEPSQRQLRIAQEIRKIIAGALEKGEVRNPLILDNLVTITDVDISPDLKYCTVYFMTLNGKIWGRLKMIECRSLGNEKTDSFQIKTSLYAGFELSDGYFFCRSRQD